VVKATRRGFLVAGAAVGGTVAGALALGVGFLSTVDTEGLGASVRDDGRIGLTAWITIHPEGAIIFNIPRLEMGQGIHTAMAMLIAEELDIDLVDPRVVVEHARENLPVYANMVLALRKRPEDISGAADWIGQKIFSLVPFIATGGSSSIVDAYTPLRRAGAVAREMLISAAARNWEVDRADCLAKKGHILHIPSGLSVSYGDIAAAAAEEKPNKDIKLKATSGQTVIGKPVPRVDIPAKTRGEATFGIDVQLDGMKYAAVVQSPVFGGRVANYDESAAKEVRGYIKTVDLGDGVAVVADSYYRAKEASALLDVSYDLPTGAKSLDTTSVRTALQQALDNDPGHVFVDDGGIDELLQAGGDTHRVTYEVPYLAHACMEPMNATAFLNGNIMEIWTGTQTPLAMDWAVADVLDDVDEVLGNTVFAGGGFGRRVEKDAIVHAVKVAATMPGVPVKAIWTREEDMQHDVYRPAVAANLEAVLDSDGRPAALDYKIALQSVGLSFSRRNMPIEEGGANDPGNVEGALHMPYTLGSRRIASAAIENPVPVGNWRSVGHSYNSFFVESFIDELAMKAGQDPMAYRLGLLAENKRMTALAQQLAAHSRWGASVAENEGRGIALHPSFRSLAGLVIDISKQGDMVKIDKVTCVVDCGRVINPDTVAAQMEGGIIYGLTAAMFGEITLTDGQVDQANFPDYPMLHMHQCPEINVHIIESDELPGGVGEPGTPPVFPALANAYYALTGERLRSMPLVKHGIEFL
jgi:isoquinoline 1-oxidoreductase beta subunit